MTYTNNKRRQKDPIHTFSKRITYSSRISNRQHFHLNYLTHLALNFFYLNQFVQEKLFAYKQIIHTHHKHCKSKHHILKRDPHKSQHRKHIKSHIKKHSRSQRQWTHIQILIPCPNYFSRLFFISLPLIPSSPSTHF